MANLVVKDHSRLGRNRLVVGQLLEEDFVQLNVRYIAIMDNIDTANGVGDIVPMQDLFNEWHAKNTSDKVRRVMQSRGNAGIPLTTNVSYGYKKDPEDKNRWIVDEPAVETVRRIFQMCVSGLGPTQIAKRLKADGVLTPSEYQRNINVNCPTKLPEYLHKWCSRTNNYKQGQAYFFCSSYRKNTDLCSAHYIREKVVEQLVLEGLQRLLWYVQVYEKRFGLQEKKELTAKRRELDKAKSRVAEIDQLIQKSYEDMSKGLLSEERFATLTVSLESEQRQLKADIPELEASLNATADKAGDLQKFIQRARQVTRLTELTPEIVHEFIDKIVVSKPEKIDGKRHQRVDIHYNTIGLWCAPSPEEMEKLFQEHLADKRKKTA